MKSFEEKPMTRPRSLASFLCITFALMAIGTDLQAKDMKLKLRYQQATSENSGRFHTLTKTENWNPKETAVIVCDVWDYHHCLNAVRRLEQFAPKINAVLKSARKQGATIIHSPSDCMPAYKDHAARRRAIQTPAATKSPQDVKAWCSRIPSEERALYPIDQSDGGEDDDPEEHAKWAAKLKVMGRNPGLPWQRQSDLIEIDAGKDFISDRGDEVWNILQQRGIKNVILTGVHVNMCVLGRPFGLRQMVRNGKNVVLMRDMTDTMYNPKRWPYVSHFTGNDLVISHIERFVCPTITSDQVLGGQPFEFKNDSRPHLLIVVAEDGYKLNETLPKFAAEQLGHDFKVSYAFGSETERNSIPGFELLDEADIVLLAVRRRLLPVNDMKRLRQFVAAGKPVVGLRTSSHAFYVRLQQLPKGLADWPLFDADVFGGNYTGDHNNKGATSVWTTKGTAKHPILAGLNLGEFVQSGSLYKTSPLAKNTTTLLTGKLEGHPQEPVAWTFNRADSGRSFYTSMGHTGDFENPTFVKLFANALAWAADIKRSNSTVPSNHWELTSVPAKSPSKVSTWYRCVVRLPADWVEGLQIELPKGSKAWINGNAIESGKPIDSAGVYSDDYNLLVVRAVEGLKTAPSIVSGKKSLVLKGRWQTRVGDDSSWSNIPLPAKFGGSTDIVFEP
jgi:nicotinamidase-related amidase/type 1 glutamine amidotransferase